MAAAGRPAVAEAGNAHRGERPGAWAGPRRAFRCPRHHCPGPPDPSAPAAPVRLPLPVAQQAQGARPGAPVAAAGACLRTLFRGAPFPLGGPAAGLAPAQPQCSDRLRPLRRSRAAAGVVGRGLAQAPVYPSRRTGRGRVAGAAEADPGQPLPGGGAAVGIARRGSPANRHRTRGVPAKSRAVAPASNRLGGQTDSAIWRRKFLRQRRPRATVV
ncbi:hypothetical protein PAERUG_P54_1_London_24_VIM_2_04_13_05457 [Pseudomonas aeruginosa]|nr:hypothetical protein PAERUG_P54_1_London_24_VIM_2_04_13_05457 [Pseudomonas aeruginosa]